MSSEEKTNYFENEIEVKMTENEFKVYHIAMQLMTYSN